MVSLLSRFVLTPEPCKFLHNFRGKGLEPCYASLVKKKATPVLTWLLTLAKICGTRANSTVTEFERLIRVNGLQGGGGVKKMIRTSILVQFEPCNIGPRISPGLIVHNSNFSSSKNNNERVS